MDRHSLGEFGEKLRVPRNFSSTLNVYVGLLWIFDSLYRAWYTGGVILSQKTLDPGPPHMPDLDDPECYPIPATRTIVDSPSAVGMGRCPIADGVALLSSCPGPAARTSRASPFEAR